MHLGYNKCKEEVGKMHIQNELFALQDTGYRDFHARLMPTVDISRIIGIRTPALRRFSKTVPPDNAAAFMRELPHTYYEENNLHALFISGIRDFNAALAETERFLPYIDNLATCDMFFPKVFQKNAVALLPHIQRWVEAREEYTVRFAIGLLMRLFLDEKFSPEYPALVADIRREEYYIHMMVAWYFATALSKQYDAILPFLQKNALPIRTHNKAIQKAVESYRIPDDVKAYLKTLRR